MNLRGWLAASGVAARLDNGLALVVVIIISV